MSSFRNSLISKAVTDDNFTSMSFVAEMDGDYIIEVIGGVGEETTSKHAEDVIPDPNKPSTKRQGFLLKFDRTLIENHSNGLIFYARFRNGTRMDSSAIQLSRGEHTIAHSDSYDEIRIWVDAKTDIATTDIRLSDTEGNPYQYTLTLNDNGDFLCNVPLDYCRKKIHLSAGTHKITLAESNTSAKMVIITPA